jgi:hypothetical protein
MADDPLTSPAATEETARELFRALVRLHGERKIVLRCDYKRLEHIDSPVGSEADGNIWAYAVLALVLLTFWFAGWKIAGAVAVAGIVAYYTAGRAYVRKKIQRRVEERALGELDVWQKLWRFGGVALEPPAGGEVCAAPQGNWMALVRSLR